MVHSLEPVVGAKKISWTKNSRNYSVFLKHHDFFPPHVKVEFTHFDLIPHYCELEKKDMAPINFHLIVVYCKFLKGKDYC